MKKLIFFLTISLGFLTRDCLANNLKKWSILICTLEERKASFDRLYNKLVEQIKKSNLENEIEIICFSDNREVSVGYKRNYLLQKSQGEYINFIDDDDDISSNYIDFIYSKLQKKPDCVGLVGIITVDGKSAKKFIHSIKYDHYFQEKNIYYRPPNHLNPIKRLIAIQFAFPDKYFGEDTDWAMSIARSGLLKTEEEVEEPYYFYRYSSKKH